MRTQSIHQHRQRCNRCSRNSWGVERTASIVYTLEEEGPLVSSKENKDTGGTQGVITGQIQWRYATQMHQSLEIGELGEREARSPQEHCHVSGRNALGVADAHEWGQVLRGKACEQVCRFQRCSRLFYKSAWHHTLHAFYKCLHWLKMIGLSRIYSNLSVLSLPNQCSEKEDTVLSASDSKLCWLVRFTSKHLPFAFILIPFWLSSFHVLPTRFLSFLSNKAFEQETTERQNPSTTTLSRKFQILESPFAIRF